MKSNPQQNVNQNSNGAKPNTTGSQNNTNNKANTNPTGSTKPSSSTTTNRSANSTSSTSSSTRLSNADYNRLAAQIVGVPTDKNGNPVCNSYEQYTQFGQTLANLHNGGINANSTPHEIAAASVGAKNNTPNIFNPSQLMGYSKALVNLLKDTQQGVSSVDTTPAKASPTSSEQEWSDTDKVIYAVEILASENTGIKLDLEGNPDSKDPAVRDKFYAERNRLMENKDKIMAAAAAKIPVDQNGEPKPGDMNAEIAYKRAYELLFGNVNKNKGKEPAVINNNIMEAYMPYKDGSATDYTANKMIQNYTSLNYPGSDQLYIQENLAKTDPETGIRYVTVDGLVDANGNPAKVYCAAFAGIVNTAATGQSRCGDIVKVTWEDGTYDYMVVGDAKGQYKLGHTVGVTEYDSKGRPHTPNVSNAIELIVDNNSGTDLYNEMLNAGAFGSGGNAMDNSVAGVQHWSQAFTNIEVLDYNVITASKK